MATIIRQDIDFHGLFRKLGHSLEEIRVRTLENILSKLEHKLICEADLVNERHLFIRLLEWFNFTSCPKTVQVLNLLNQLSQHSAAAEIIQDIGGLEFLTQLREHVDPTSTPIIDQILEHTMRLPDVKIKSHAPECIFHKPTDTGIHQTLTSINESSRSQPMSVTSTSHLTSMQVSSSDRLQPYDEQSPGYFVTSQPQQDCQQPDIIQTGSSSSFYMTVFPWLPLTPTDRHVLASTNTSLQSKDINLLISASEFLSDVVIQDFPAEVFLQRPDIIKSLLSLLNLPSDEGKVLATHAARTLTDLTRSLHTRMKYYQDPVLYTPKIDFCSSTSITFSPSGSSSNQSVRSSDPRPTVIGWSDARHRGDGRDQDSSTSSNRNSSIGMEADAVNTLEETDFEESQNLQFHQMTLPQFCILTTHKALPLLRCAQGNVIAEVLQLLHEVLSVMLKVVMKDVWQDSADAARDVVEKLSDSFEIIGGLLDYHHHGNTQDDRPEPADLPLHRLTYVGICNYLMKLLRLVPTSQAYNILPGRLTPSLGSIIFDESLGQTYTETRLSALTFIQELDPKVYDMYCRAMQICLSFNRSCQLLTSVRDHAVSAGERVSLVEQSVSSLPYHLHLAVITEFINIFSNLRSKSSTDQSDISRCKNILLIFLSHPNTQIRQYTYFAIHSTIQTSLNVNEASDPKSRSCVRVKFLFDTAIIFEIVTFGLADKESKIASLSSEILLNLLQGQLLMTETLWLEFTNSLLKSLPILQSYTDSTTILGRRIRGQLDPTSTVDNLPLLEKLRGNLRLMFSSDARVRNDALLQLSWFLTNESDSEKKIPKFADLDLTSLPNIFITEKPLILDDNSDRSVFKGDSLKQVYEIFTSSPVDPGVKKSAADQLAIMMQDRHLHGVFRQLGGLETMLEYIRQAVVKHDDAEQNDSLQFVPACVCMLRYLIHHDYTLRHNLTHDTETYYCLLRVALLFEKNEKISYEISHIFSLLLHDEIIKLDVSNKDGRRLTFPAIISKRYRLPFHPSLHDEKSPHMVTGQPEDDPLMTGEPLEMLRVSWNVAWNSGMESLLDLLKKRNNLTEIEEPFSAALRLTHVDKKVLGVTELKWGLQQAVFSISNATSHTSVSSALQRLTMYLTIIQGTAYVDVVNAVDWFQAMGRFLQITPTSAADEGLLFGVLRLITMVLKQSNHCPEHILQWLGEKMYHASSPMIRLLNRSAAGEDSDGVSETVVDGKRSLDKQLLHFISTFSCRLPYQLSKRLNLHQMRGELCKRLILRLNITDAPHFYNLASLEGTLHCLVHITARPGWSQECSDLDRSSLCSQVLGCLLEVVSAFHVGRGGTAMSFMGKGVTKSATLCLRHLAYEMAVLSDDKDWVKQWLYSSQRTDAGCEPGLNWMLTLWAYRDPEVRSAGLGIAVTLTSTETGRLMITSNCKHIPGGIWGAAFSMLLDQSECSMVRQQAALLLVNLTSEPMPSGSVDMGNKCWQGPVVIDSEFDISLVGLTALLALLHHSQFYAAMLTLLSTFYPHSLVQPVSVTLEMQLMSTASSETTLSTSAASVNRTDRSQGSIHDPTFQSQPSDEVSGSLHQTSQSQLGPHTSTTSASSAATPHSRQARVDAVSNSTQEAECRADCQSVTTPCLVSAVCRLIHNLAVLTPQDTFQCLKHNSFIPLLTSLINPMLLHECCKHIQCGESGGQSELCFRDLVQMNDSIVQLLCVCVVYDTATRLEILADKDAMSSLVSLLLIQCEDDSDLMFESNKLCTSILNFFTMLIQLQNTPALESLTSAFAKVWMRLSVRLTKMIEQSGAEVREMKRACLTFLSVMCCEEAKMSFKHPDHVTATKSLSSLLETPAIPGSEEKDGETRSTGSIVCKALIGCYDLVTLKNSDEPPTLDGTLIVNAVKSLLVISQSAKETALEMGLVEISLEHVQKIYVQLNLETLHMTKPTGKKKDEPLVQEIVLTFDLLRNFMFQNQKVKLACYHSGLSNICHRLWSWCCLESSLMFAVISLLTTYSAHCPTASSSLAYTTSSSASSSSSGKSQLSNNSLVHNVIKLAARELGRESALMLSVFRLLSTLMLSSECRSVLWKGNFLSDFSRLNPKRTKKTKQKNLAEVCWFELLMNLSFSVEGQQMILNIAGCVDLILDFLESGPPRCQECAILILRNLCCHASNKQKLLANEKLIPFMLQSIEEGRDTTQAVAASALWALVYNNQKAKVLMKNANILVTLKEVLRKVKNSGTKSQLVIKCTEDLRATISLVAK